jgi:hypothetical protein
MMQVFFNSDGTSVTAIITIVVNGVHTNPDSWPITNDPAIVLSTHPSATKTVTAIDTGVFKVVWTGLSPALTHGETFFVAIDGLLSTVAWTTWQMPFQCVLLPSTVTALALVATDTGTTIPDLVSALTNQPSSAPVERSPNDTNPITFSWPVSGATITAEASLDNAAYGATVGAVTFLRTEGSLHYYSLAFNAADRPTAEGTARYKLADGTYTQYVTLRVEGASTDAAGIRSAVGLASANLDSQLGTILADTNELQLNQGDWLTATGFSTHTAADVYTEFGDGANLTTLTTATGFSTQASVDVIDGIVDSILVDTNELQTNQGDWATATGFATQASVDVIDGIVDAILVDTDDLQLNQGSWLTATGFATQASVDVIDGIVDSILLDTNELQLSQGDWATATGFSTHAASDVYTAFGDGSNLTTLTTATGFATVNADNAGVAAIKTKTDQLVFTVANQVDSNALTGGGSGATASEVRIEMDANSTKLASILVDTDDLQTNQGGWVTATGFSTHAAADVWDVGTRALTVTGLDAISEWTVNVMGSLSGNVGGIAGTINTLDALNNSIPSGVVTQLNNTTYDGVLYTDAIVTLLSMAQGRINESNSGVFEFYSQDNSTLLYTLTKSGNERLRT